MHLCQLVKVDKDNYRDLKNSLDTDREEGEAKGEIKGIMKGKIEIGLNMLSMGMSVETIIQLTGLSEMEIKDLL